MCNSAVEMRSSDPADVLSRPGVVSGAAEESAGGEAEAEGGRAEQTLCDDLDDPQPQQRQDEE